MKRQALWSMDKTALPSEMVSLSERLSLMLIVRFALVLVVWMAGYFSIVMHAAAERNLLLCSAIYLGVSVIFEGLRRITGGRGLVLIGILLLIDGLFLAWVTYATGGATSPLRFLLFAHLVTVTLLASYRTGLKIALWHSLLVLVAFYSQLAGFIPPVEVKPATTPVAQTPFHRMAVYNLIAFWFVAIATAAYSAINERRLRRRGFDLEALAALATELDQVADGAGAAKRLVNVAADTFDFKRAAVLVLGGNKLRVAAERGCELRPQSELLADAAIRASRETLRPSMTNKLDAKANPALAALFPEMKRILLVPLIVENSWVGVMVAEGSTKRGYRVDESVLAVVEQFAGHAALAMSNVWLLEQVQRMANTDALTGVANRLRFDSMLMAEINRSRRSGEHLGLLMLDIDHFKALNDRYGHQAGDEMLRRLAATIRKVSRDFDTVARYGGEEFAIILPMADPKACAQAGERLRRAVEQMKAPVPITISVGTASFPNNAMDADSLVRAADEALYESKRSGRNRVSMSVVQSLASVQSIRHTVAG
ncbi:MAG: GGDEF domain-containing protein [Actinomycetota bacterium]|nr:GGDEF domain-containing protein [Actinomycetota bacterium]